MHELIPPTALPQQERREPDAALFALLVRQTARYTAGDSSSVPVEIAQELLQSLVFTLPLGTDTGDPATRLTAGQQTLRLLMDDCDRLLRETADAPPPCTNRAYRDTLASISSYRKRYDVLFFAHQIPADIDYPLAHAVDEQMQGICYLKEYLRRIVLENRFLRQFGAAETAALLAGASPDPDEMSLNLYEPVVSAALALILLEEDPTTLDVTAEGRAALTRRFQACDGEVLRCILTAAADALGGHLGLTADEDLAYLKHAAMALVPRILAALPAGRLDGVFPSPQRNTPPPAPVWVDGDSMPDQALRGLIAELCSCRYRSDKLALVTRSVHSISDLIEVLNVCFHDTECDAVFDRYGPPACLALLQAVQQQPAGWTSETGWERRLRRYLLHHLKA